MIGMLSYPTGRQHFNISDENEIPLQARALAWCMDVTDMDALFNKEDLFEFLVRLFAAIPELRAEENFAQNDYLFEFHWEGMPYRMYPEDLAACLGLYVWDIPENNFSRVKWIQGLPNFRKSACYSAFFKQTLNPLHPKKPGEVQSGPPITLEDLVAKESLVSYLMSCIGEDVFLQFEKECGRELTALRKMVTAAKKGLPISFDWSALSPEVKDAFLRKCMGKYYQENLPEAEIEDDWRFVKDLAHLVWGVNNGLAHDLNTLHIDPRWDLDIDRYEGLGIDGMGINLLATWRAFGLDGVKHLIKREIPESLEWEWKDFPEPSWEDSDEFGED